MFAFHRSGVFFHPHFLITHSSKTEVGNKNNVYLSNSVEPFLNVSHMKSQRVCQVSSTTQTLFVHLITMPEGGIKETGFCKHGCMLNNSQLATEVASLSHSGLKPG